MLSAPLFIENVLNLNGVINPVSTSLKPCDYSLSLLHGFLLSGSFIAEFSTKT
jgi:hypothetical protein